MAFKLIESDSSEEEFPEKEGLPRQKAAEGLKKFGQFAEGVAHQQVSATAEIPSQILGYPGNLFNFINEVAARPITELITNKPAREFKETYLGKVFPTSKDVRDKFEKALPYLKPRNDYEKFTNNIYGLGTLFMLPGGQANLGLMPRAPATLRAFIKSVGTEVAGATTEKLTGSEEKGDMVRMGAMFTMGLADQRGVQSYLGNIYNRASRALEDAGNPTVNASRLTNTLTNLRNRLTQGTRAPSETAVIEEIDRILAHVQNGEIAGENLWGSLRSLNENRLAANRSIAGRQNRLRARNMFNRVAGALHEELNDLGTAHPQFGEAFQEAQLGTRTVHQSNLIQRSLENMTGFELQHPGIMHLFGGGIGATAAAAKHSVFNLANIAGAGAYQVSKLLYRMATSPALRRFYFNALRQGVQENIPKMANEIQKMDKELTKEDKKEKPYRLIKKSSQNLP